MVEPAVDDVAPDGSPVPVYLAMPAHDALDLVHDQVPPGGSMLDLGCGVGRLANALADAGFAVTGVDIHERMLAHLSPSVDAVHADIADLDLGMTFDVVVLASHLVNHPTDAGVFLTTCRRHVADNGVVLVERFAPGHDRGASHGDERIWRHAYTDPAYVEMALAADEGWDRLERAGGAPLRERAGCVEHGEGAELEALARTSAACGVETERLTAEEIDLRQKLLDDLTGALDTAAPFAAAGAPLAARWHRQAIPRIADPAPLSEAEIEAEDRRQIDCRTGRRGGLLFQHLGEGGGILR